MNPQQQEEIDAQNARTDRFDGFDRGDLDRDHEADQLAKNIADLIDEMRAEIVKLDAMEAPRFSHVVYTVNDFNPIHIDHATGVYRVFGEQIAFFADPAKSRKLANLFCAQKIRCSTSTFKAWRAARIDYLKGMIDRLNQ